MSRVETQMPQLIGRINFKTASARVSQKDARAVEGNAKELQKYASAIVILEGHCDERGDAEYNLELGDRRARNVMEELMRMGVSPDRLIVVSKGEIEPLDSRHHEAAWRKNRRVEFILR